MTIQVRAAGMNPADAKHVGRGKDEDFPRPVGYEVAGVVTAVRPNTEIGSDPWPSATRCWRFESAAAGRLS